MYLIELWHPGGRITYAKHTRKGVISVDSRGDATTFQTKAEATAVAADIAAPMIARVVFLIPHLPEGGCSEPEGQK